MFWLLIVVMLIGFAVLFYGDVKGRFRTTVLGAVVIVAAWIPLLLHAY